METFDCSICELNQGGCRSEEMYAASCCYTPLSSEAIKRRLREQYKRIWANPYYVNAKDWAGFWIGLELVSLFKRCAVDTPTISHVNPKIITTIRQKAVDYFKSLVK